MRTDLPPGRCSITRRCEESTCADGSAARAQAFGRPVIAVHVADPLSSMFDVPHVDRTEYEGRRTARSHDVELIVRVGEHVGAESVDVAEPRPAARVVVGTRQVRGRFGPTLGEVTDHMLDQDHLAVAVVPIET